MQKQYQTEINKMQSDMIGSVKQSKNEWGGLKNTLKTSGED
jgi:hypothetical protein